jgi:hypothetical protein
MIVFNYVQTDCTPLRPVRYETNAQWIWSGPLIEGKGCRVYTGYKRSLVTVRHRILLQ